MAIVALPAYFINVGIGNFIVLMAVLYALTPQREPF
jgi:hypothetical protein